MASPLPRGPSRWSSGIAQPSSAMAQVSEARMPSLSSSFCGLKPRRVGRDDERREALLAELRVGDREHDGHRGALAVGDELLGAVEDPAAVLQHGARLEVVRLAPGLRLGEAEAADLPARGHVRQPRLLLRVAAPREDRPAAHGVVHAHEGRGRRAAGGDLLHRERVGDVVARTSRPIPPAPPCRAGPAPPAWPPPRRESSLPPPSGRRGARARPARTRAPCRGSCAALR